VDHDNHESVGAALYVVLNKLS